MFVLRRLRFAFDRLPTFFEEPEVARYVTLGESAGGFTIPDPAASLPLSDRHFRDIDAPGLIPRSLPVIFFRTAHTGSPQFGVRLNTTPLTQQTVSQAGPHAWHEIVPAGALKPEDNELTFSVQGEGNVTFSDVVILYQSNQLTVRRPLPDQVLDPG
jgi:hypothetical protein